MNLLISSGSYIFTDHVPGGEMQIVHAMVTGLARRGHRLWVLTPMKRLRREIPNVTVFELGGYNFLFPPSYSSCRFAWWKYSWQCRRQAKHILRNEQIDIIHHIRPSFPGRFSLCTDLRPPFFFGPAVPISRTQTAEEYGGEIAAIRAHETWWDQIKNKLVDRLDMTLGRWLWDRTLRRSTRLLINLEKARESLGEWGHRAKVRLVPSLVDTRLFCPVETKPDRPRILFVGYLSRRKGVDYLLRGLPAVRQQLPDVILDIVGDYTERGSFERLTTELGLSDCVRFHGEVPFDHIVPVFQNCSVFCLPSLGEASAVTLFQAMACGKPIVTTRVGGSPWIVEDGQGGRLVPPRDPEALAQALVDLLTDPDQRKRMGEFNRRRALERYDVEVVIDRLEEVYRECLPTSWPT